MLRFALVRAGMRSWASCLPTCWESQTRPDSPEGLVRGWYFLPLEWFPTGWAAWLQSQPTDYAQKTLIKSSCRQHYEKLFLDFKTHGQGKIFILKFLWNPHFIPFINLCSGNKVYSSIHPTSLAQGFRTLNWNRSYTENRTKFAKIFSAAVRLLGRWFPLLKRLCPARSSKEKQQQPYTGGRT